MIQSIPNCNFLKIWQKTRIRYTFNYWEIFNTYKKEETVSVIIHKLSSDKKKYKLMSKFEKINKKLLKKLNQFLDLKLNFLQNI
jgi:hypothetical protein